MGGEMLGTWKILKKITDKNYKVRCDSCGFETQRLKSKIKFHHRCPSIIDGKKYCYKCQNRKELNYFFKDPTVFGGFSKLCKECHAEKKGSINFSYKPVNRRDSSKPSFKRKYLSKDNTTSTKLNGIEKFFHLRQCSLKNRHKAKLMDPYNLPDGYLYNQYKLQDGKCYYTGYKFDYTQPRSPFSISVDKLIPNKGYTVGNIVLCTQSMNTMKLNMSISEFIDHLKSIKDGLNNFISENSK